MKKYDLFYFCNSAYSNGLYSMRYARIQVRLGASNHFESVRSKNNVKEKKLFISWFFIKIFQQIQLKMSKEDALTTPYAEEDTLNWLPVSRS